MQRCCDMNCTCTCSCHTSRTIIITTSSGITTGGDYEDGLRRFYQRRLQDRYEALFDLKVIAAVASRLAHTALSLAGIRRQREEKQEFDFRLYLVRCRDPRSAVFITAPVVQWKDARRGNPSSSLGWSPKERDKAMPKTPSLSKKPKRVHQMSKTRWNDIRIVRTLSYDTASEYMYVIERKTSDSLGAIKWVEVLEVKKPAYSEGDKEYVLWELCNYFGMK